MKLQKKKLLEEANRKLNKERNARLALEKEVNKNQMKREMQDQKLRKKQQNQKLRKKK